MLHCPSNILSCMLLLNEERSDLWIRKNRPDRVELSKILNSSSRGSCSERKGSKRRRITTRIGEMWREWDQSSLFTLLHGLWKLMSYKRREEVFFIHFLSSLFLWVVHSMLSFRFVVLFFIQILFYSSFPDEYPSRILCILQRSRCIGVL